MTMNPTLFVIAAPSGAGKTTLVKALVDRNPALKFSISYTTRSQRLTEEDGRDYFFVDNIEFEHLRRDGEMLESAVVFDNQYGTSRSQVEQHLSEGHHVILEIDWQGAQQVRESMRGCVTIFILPPSRPEPKLPKSCLPKHRSAPHCLAPARPVSNRLHGCTPRKGVYVAIHPSCRGTCRPIRVECENT